MRVGGQRVNNRSRNILVYILIIAAIAAIVFGVRNNSANSKELSYQPTG